jgi:suppressor of G2 allele of SKP1
MSTQAALGMAALNANNYAEAITHYTSALRSSPESPDYYIKRSIAHQRSSPPDYDAALSDASIAVVAATKRARRELIVQAQLRRGIALFCLKRYGDAKFVFDIVQEMDPKEKQLPMWQAQVTSKLNGLDKDDEMAKVSVEKLPNVQIPDPEKESKATIKSDGKSASSSESKGVSVPAQTPASKIKYDWYQNQSKIYFSLLAKGVPKDKAVVEIQGHSITISFPTGLETTYDFSLDPLYEPINPANSTYNITPSKIEITLEKLSPKKWPTLESNDSINNSSTKTTDAPIDKAMKAVVLGDAKEANAPVYPTSSKHGPKNWEKLASDMEVDKEGDDINNFFQNLYSSADPDVRRAMMKSYQESNGTVLSTNWEDVGKGKVETSPPDGMIEKKWD